MQPEYMVIYPFPDKPYLVRWFRLIPKTKVKTSRMLFEFMFTNNYNNIQVTGTVISEQNMSRFNNGEIDQIIDHYDKKIYYSPFNRPELLKFYEYSGGNSYINLN